MRSLQAEPLEAGWWNKQNKRQVTGEFVHVFDLQEAPPEIGLCQVGDRSAKAMSAAELTNQPAVEPLRYLRNGAQGLNSPAAAF